ncbi:MAG: isochorismate synthase [Parabacteroides sp.]|nr:isochorismate synthase [Parabacteroides sp.]
MTEFCTEARTGIDTLTEKDCCLALFRLPFTSDPVCMIQSTGSPAFLSDISRLNGQTGFVFAPFALSQNYPLILMQPDIRLSGQAVIGRLGELPQLKRLQLPSDTAREEEEASGAAYPFERYAAVFPSFLRPLRQHTFGKLVLSRTQTCEKGSGFSASSAFFKACRQYPSAFVYLFHSPHTGTWLGSSPEPLLSVDNRQGHTVALAGTKKMPSAPGEVVRWDKKNRYEQQVVSEYIRTRLLSYGLTWREEGPRTTQAGKICHLLTDFYFDLADTGRLGDLLALLHPTPAVCGVPKEAAIRHILENEGYDRGYYSGFTGWLVPGGKSDLFVNLRCMQIGRKRLTLYAGGGIMPDSDVRTEWYETENKLQTMLTLLE